MPDIIGIILWPLKWVVEFLLVAWHAIFTFLGMGAAEGITWVLSIVGLVIVVRSALIPIFVRQIKSQRKMMEIAPELRKIQDKYKGKRDQLSREAMSRETMALYKKNGTSPVSGCLPLLIQMPVFLAFVTLAVWARRREGRLIARNLLVYCTSGWITAPEVTMLASLTTRRAARVWARRTGGRPAARAMKIFQELGTELAFLRERLVRGSADSDAPTRELAILGALGNCRALFLPSARGTG